MIIGSTHKFEIFWQIVKLYQTPQFRRGKFMIMVPLYPSFPTAPSSRRYSSEGCREELEENPGCREEGDPVGNWVVEEVEFAIEDFLQQRRLRSRSCRRRRRCCRGSRENLLILQRV